VDVGRQPVAVLVYPIAIGVKDRVAIPREREQHGMTESSRRTNHEIREHSDELHGRGKVAPLHELAGTRNKAAGERSGSSEVAR
jgi:hypothetical protein